MVLVENFFSDLQFPSHTVTADEEAAGFEVWHVANGRRSLDDHWTPTTANVEHRIKVLCDRIRAANMVIVDRAHNLRGKVVKLETRQGGDVGPRLVLTATIPTVVGGDLDGTDGVLTEEGAWLKRFPIDIGLQWHMVINAMGAGLVPQVVGCWLGLSLTLEFLGLPSADEQDELLMDEQTTASGWVGGGEPVTRASGELDVRAPDYMGYDHLRYHLRGHFGHRRPMWLLHDEEQADQAVLVARPPGTLGFSFTRDWGWRRGSLSYFEWEPAR